MTVEVETSNVTATGIVDGVAINCNFPCESASHVVVTYGADLVATLGVHYNVTLAPASYATFQVTPIAGFAALSGGTINIAREVPYLQTLDIPNVATIAASRLEQGLDYATFMVQTVRDIFARSLVYRRTDPDNAKAPLPAPADRANKFLAFDALGKPIAAAAVTDGGTPVSTYGASLVSAADASAAQTVLGMSTYFKTLLGAASASALQTLLGMSTFFKTLLGATDFLTWRGELRGEDFGMSTAIADNTAAWNAAYAAHKSTGRELVIGPGVFLFTQPVAWDRAVSAGASNNCGTIRGAGRRATIFKMNAVVASPCFREYASNGVHGVFNGALKGIGFEYSLSGSTVLELGNAALDGYFNSFDYDVAVNHGYTGGAYKALRICNHFDLDVRGVVNGSGKAVAGGIAVEWKQVQFSRGKVATGNAETLHLYSDYTDDNVFGPTSHEEAVTAHKTTSANVTDNLFLKGAIAASVDYAYDLQAGAGNDIDPGALAGFGGTTTIFKPGGSAGGNFLSSRYALLATPAVPSSTVGYLNESGQPQDVYITGGTVSKVEIDSVTHQQSTEVLVVLRNNETIKLTYSSLPGWIFRPHT